MIIPSSSVSAIATACRSRIVGTIVSKKVGTIAFYSTASIRNNQQLLNKTIMGASTVTFGQSSLMPPPTTTTTTSVRTLFHLPDHSKELISPKNALTKIVATIGPTSEQELPLQTVTDAGMNIMRLNFSHATPEEVELRIRNLKKAQSVLYNNEQVVGVLLDTKGPEMRTGKLRNDISGHDTITLQQGQTITLQTNDSTRDAGSTETDLYIDFKNLSQVVKIGSNVLLDDGACILTVTSTSNKEYGSVTCSIDNTATLRSRAGVNLPYADISQHSLPALSDKDKSDILYGMSKEVDIDFVAASFVQTGQGVLDIRAYIEECATKLGYTPDQPRPLIISKIETGSGLQNFEDILKYSDAIMVARGDLGVEIPLQQVTNAQKQMIAACNTAGKPVIVATQMLESMTKNPRPTRAEVADVTNAVYDGADAVMTSGETAKGKYPADTINFMQSILVSAEQYAVEASDVVHVHPFQNDIPNTSSAVVAAAAVTAANRTPDCQAIIVMHAQQPSLATAHDNLATLVAGYRPTHVPILAVCATEKIARQLTLFRGIKPIIGTGIDGRTAVQRAKDLYKLQSGKPFVLVDTTTTTSCILEIGTLP